MRVLFVSGDPHAPQISGGVQSSTEQLIGLLQQEGHVAAVAGGLHGGGSTALKSRIKMKLTRKRYSHELYNGYSVFRAWDVLAQAGKIVNHYKPDVVVVQHNNTVPLSLCFEAMGIPVVVYLRNVEYRELNGDLGDLSSKHFIANSSFTGESYRSRYNIEPVIIPPLIDRVKYYTHSDRENITFINPAPLKGLATSIAIAEACPDIPFCFVESWSLSLDVRAGLMSSIAHLPNVSFMPRTQNMKTVYGKAKILLAPSVWEEAWGRVASEAHVSGIPVVGSTQGGLPEAIGSGGVALDINAPLSDWVAVIRRLWDDHEYYDHMSMRASEFSLRDDINPSIQIKRMIAVLQDAVGT